MPYPRRNSDIALYLLSKFRALIENISYKMGARYHLSTEDRHDLVSAAHAKISTTRWRTVLHRGGNRPLENYTIMVITTTMAKELRRIKAAGLSGLSKGPKLGEFPLHESEQWIGVDWGFNKPALVTFNLTDRLAAQELADRARLVLVNQEWEVVELTFGFDGGPSRTPVEVAGELDLPVSKVECLLETALQRIRRAMPR